MEDSLAACTRDKAYDLALTFTVISLRAMHAHVRKRCVQQCLFLFIIAPIRNNSNAYQQQYKLICHSKFLQWNTTRSGIQHITMRINKT